MATGRFVSYLRVSTQRQGKSGLGLDAQREAVRSYLDGGRWKLVGEFVEIESGKRSDRPALQQALAESRLKKATLIIAKLDRLARNVHFVSGLMESNVDFVAVDFPQANRLTVHILAAVAEHEAHLISERTKAALEAARRRGVRLGGDRGNLPAVSRQGTAASVLVRQRKVRERNADVLPRINAMRQEGMTIKQVVTKLNEDHIPAPRGGKWYPTTVCRILNS